MTIGEISEKTGLPESTLRYYEKKGLLRVARDGGGRRDYGEGDIAWIQFLRRLKETGMPLKEIRAFMELSRQGDATIDRRLGLIEKQRRSVLDQMEQLEDTLLMLDYKQWYYQTAQKAGTCAVHDAMPLEEVPERFRPLKEEWATEK